MARRLPEGDAGLLLIKEGKMSQELLFMILAGLAEALVLYLFIKNGIKQGLVHELGTILSMAAAVLVLYLVMRVFHGFTDAQYDKVVVGIVMLVLVSAVFSVCRLIFFAVKMAAKLPVIRLVDSILGSVGGLAEGLIVLYVVETISRYFIDLQLNLVTRGVPVVYNFAMQLLRQ